MSQAGVSDVNAVTAALPITEVVEPDSPDALVETVKECVAARTPMYPIGGGTSLDYGLAASREGIGVSLSRLHRVLDYPSRDMTITVESGITMQQLAETLAAENQRLPLDVPRPAQATLGGVVATNFSGPLRYGHGTAREHVIGIAAVDGHGRAFKGGGRVVKNVAGYDFCKLLTGSLGTLGILTQLTLKLRPCPESTVAMHCRPRDLQQADGLLASLVHSKTTPAAIELLAGPAWNAVPELGPRDGDPWHLVVLLEGTEPEVTWMAEQLGAEWKQQDAPSIEALSVEATRGWMPRLADFPAEGDAPLVLKASVVPSRTVHVIELARQLDAGCSIQAHAGNGIVLIRCSEFPREGLTRTVVGQLQAACAAGHGNLVVLSNPSGAEKTHQSVWGGIDAPFGVMNRVKQAFDPHHLLNPGRFVYTLETD